MRESLIDDFFLTIKGEWQKGFEGKYRRSLVELLRLLNGVLKISDVEEYLKKESLFVSEKFLKYILEKGKIEGVFKLNAKKVLSCITAMEVTSRYYDERIEALGEEHAIKTYWEPEDESNRRRVEIISNAIALKRDEVAIDIGCGVGTFTYRAALKGAMTFGKITLLNPFELQKSLQKK